MSTSTTRVAAGVPTGGQFAATTRAESGVCLSGSADGVTRPPAADALRPALTMTRPVAENHVRTLLDQAAADGDVERIEEIASLASGRGWKGVAYVNGYPHTADRECAATDYLRTKASATRVATYAYDRLRDAETNSGARTARTEIRNEISRVSGEAPSGLRPVAQVCEDPAFLDDMEDAEREVRVRNLEPGDWVRDMGDDEWGRVEEVGSETLTTDTWSDSDTDEGDHVVNCVRKKTADRLLAEHGAFPTDADGANGAAGEDAERPAAEPRT